MGHFFRIRRDSLVVLFKTSNPQYCSLHPSFTNYLNLDFFRKQTMNQALVCFPDTGNQVYSSY